MQISRPGAPSPRIVSLIPSATEIASALGFEDHLVGRSHECDHPEGVTELPALTEPKVPLNGSSRDIDARVRSLLEDALSVYRVDADRLRALAPDVILTQSQCEICAVHLSDVEDAVCTWVDSTPTVVALEPHSLADVWDDVERVAEVLGVPDRGRALSASLQSRLNALSSTVAPTASSERPTVVGIEWTDPLMPGRGWIPTLIEHAGGTPALDPERAQRDCWDALQDANPDVLVVMACGFGIERSCRELTPLTSHPTWASLSAVKNGDVYVTDGNHYFNRPGPRLVESAEILAEILHPDTCPPTHRGSGWIPAPAMPVSTSSPAPLSR